MSQYVILMPNLILCKERSAKLDGSQPCHWLSGLLTTFYFVGIWQYWFYIIAFFWFLKAGRSSDLTTALIPITKRNVLNSDHKLSSSTQPQANLLTLLKIITFEIDAKPRYSPHTNYIHTQKPDQIKTEKNPHNIIVFVRCVHRACRALWLCIPACIVCVCFPMCFPPPSPYALHCVAVARTVVYIQRYCTVRPGRRRGLFDTG